MGRRGNAKLLANPAFKMAAFFMADCSEFQRPVHGLQLQERHGKISIAQNHADIKFGTNLFHLPTSKRFACGKMAIFDVGVRSCFPPLCTCSASPAAGSLNLSNRERAHFGVLLWALCS